MRSPTSAATDATFTIDPPPRAAMPGIACLQQRNVPRALTAKTFSQTSSGVSGAFVVEPIPATLTSTSSSAIAGATCSSSRTSSCSARGFRAELARELLDRVQRDVGEDHLRALRRKAPSYGGADPGARAGDESGASAEAASFMRPSCPG